MVDFDWLILKTNNKQTVLFSNKFQNIEFEIKSFLRNKMYNNKSVLRKNNNGQRIINKLFEHIKKSTNKYIDQSLSKKNKYRAIADYISGMTDRFAIQLYKSII